MPGSRTRRRGRRKASAPTRRGRQRASRRRWQREFRKLIACSCKKRRSVFAFSLSAFKTASENVHRVLNNRCRHHCESADEKARGDLLDGGEVNAGHAKSGVDEQVGDGNEDDLQGVRTPSSGERRRDALEREGSAVFQSKTGSVRVRALGIQGTHVADEVVRQAARVEDRGLRHEVSVALRVV